MSTVYIAACLKDRHPLVHLGLARALDDAGIPLVEVPGTGNIWIRDWAPMRMPSGKWVKFRTKADTKKYPFLHVTKDVWQSLVPCDGELVTKSDLILDGGNVVRSPDGQRVIMTEQTLYDNVYHDFDVKSGKGSKRTFEELLEADIILIPSEPGDDLGHSDGIVSWINSQHVFLNDYRSLRNPVGKHYEAEVKNILQCHDIETVPFPYAYELCRDISEERFRQEHPEADDFNPATGYFLNFARWGNLIVYPTFAIERDERCLDALLDAFPGANCVGIDCTHLAEEGGLLHCVTWEA
jgi:agmatine deiminase